MRGGWVYIVTNKPNGILYTGVTRNIARRAWEHREGIIAGFTRRYGLKRLVWCEHHETMLPAASTRCPTSTAASGGASVPRRASTAAVVPLAKRSSGLPARLVVDWNAAFTCDAAHARQAGP